MTEKQLIETLDWMLQMSLITAIQYNQLYTKAIPFLKR